ncbi:MAG: ComF family protein [Methylococcaceae bacterium]
MDIYQLVFMNMGYNWLNIIQQYLFPPICILCGNSGLDNLDICHSCCKHLPVSNRRCYQCAQILESPSGHAVLCGRCLSKPPAFDQTFAPFIHQGAIRHLITSLKFSGNYKNARLLGMLLAEHLELSTPRPDSVLPVPLHKTRYRERGFNQSIEIARTVSKQLQVPLNLDSCRRHRDTPHQTELTAKQRRDNMKNAFSVVKSINADHVAIIDDVMTTGSTVNELAAVLKKAGVRRVDIWVCARA